jgi:hypothetical protein
MNRALRIFTILAVLLMAAFVFAQRGFRGGGRGYGRAGMDGVRTPRELPSGSTGTPNWTNAPGFEKDVFTFARVHYTSGYRGFSGGNWMTDTPDSDLNLSYRLQQMTSLKVDPDGRFIRLTDPELSDFGWIYIVEPGRLEFTDEEVGTLRKYLLNGGFLMIDDFWGEAEWENMEREIKRVFPERQFVDLPMDHPVFHCVFNLDGPKNKLQVPNINIGRDSETSGITWERSDAREVHIRGIFDDKGRMMIIATHNTDNGDGWEREGESAYYFKNFSEKISYPLGINIIFYAMTH